MNPGASLVMLMFHSKRSFHLNAIDTMKINSRDKQNQMTHNYTLVCPSFPSLSHSPRLMLVILYLAANVDKPSLTGALT